MTANGVLQLLLYMVVLLALVKPLGWFMARVYMGKPCGLDRVLGPVERLIYRLSGIKASEEMGWKRYTGAVMLFSADQRLPLAPRDSEARWRTLVGGKLEVHPTHGDHFAVLAEANLARVADSLRAALSSG